LWFVVGCSGAAVESGGSNLRLRFETLVAMVCVCSQISFDQQAEILLAPKKTNKNEGIMQTTGWGLVGAAARTAKYGLPLISCFREENFTKSTGKHWPFVYVAPCWQPFAILWQTKAPQQSDVKLRL